MLKKAISTFFILSMPFLLSACSALTPDTSSPKNNEQGIFVDNFPQIRANIIAQYGTEEDFKAASEFIDYEGILRSQESYSGKPTKIIGKVDQIIFQKDSAGKEYRAYRILTSPKIGSIGWDGGLAVETYLGDDVYVVPLQTDYRFIEGDWVEIYGLSDGLYRYNSIDSGVREIPFIDAINIVPFSQSDTLDDGIDSAVNGLDSIFGE